MDWLKHLTLAKIEFTIQATEPLHLPQYKGSTFRGAFGAIFKNVVCIKDDKECGSCILTKNCSYHYIFETPNSEKFPWFASPKLPHPYILEPPPETRERFEPGEQLKFNLVLVGKAIDYLPYFIFVFDDMGRRGGLGKYRKDGFGRFGLVEVCDDLAAGRKLYDGHEKVLLQTPTILTGEELLHAHERPRGDRLILNFVTPTRIKHQGEYILLKRNSSLKAETLLQNLYRRAFLMTFGHCHENSEPFRAPSFCDIQTEEMDLRWQDWKRYSNRQQRKHYFGGFVGSVALKGVLSPWLPLLKAGQYLHAGSAASFGLGKFEVKW